MSKAKDHGRKDQSPSHAYSVIEQSEGDSSADDLLTNADDGKQQPPVKLVLYVAADLLWLIDVQTV